jgi:hypothetical protein
MTKDSDPDAAAKHRQTPASGRSGGFFAGRGRAARVRGSGGAGRAAVGAGGRHLCRIPPGAVVSLDSALVLPVYRRGRYGCAWIGRNRFLDMARHRRGR